MVMTAPERPDWAGKTLRELTVTEAAAVLDAMEKQGLQDEMLRRALAARLTKRAAA
jgi:hypothetical protein